MDDIAAESGMSTRTVYRYFPAKDDILVGRFAGSAALFLATLKARPVAEPVWTSLRAAFEPLTQHVDRRQDHVSVRTLHRAIFSTPALLGRYLQQLHAAQQEAVELIRDHPPGGQHVDRTSQSLVLLATVSAAVACFVAAQETWSRADTALPLSAVLDEAMSSVAALTT